MDHLGSEPQEFIQLTAYTQEVLSHAEGMKRMHTYMAQAFIAVARDDVRVFGQFIGARCCTASAVSLEGADSHSFSDAASLDLT